MTSILPGKVWETPKPAVLAAVRILQAAFNIDPQPTTPPAGAFQGADGEWRWAEVSTKLPARNRPPRFVTVTRVGGGQPDMTVDVARLLVHCYGPDTATCEAMCNTARASFRNAVATTIEEQQRPAYANTNPVSVLPDPPAVRMFIRWYGNESGLADLPHPDILDYERWQFTADLWVKAN